MKTLYLDCAMGAAGDMLTAALLDLLPDADGFLEVLNNMNLPGVEFKLERVFKCGIAGNQVIVTVNGHEEGECNHHTSHSTLGHIKTIIDDMNIPDKIKADVFSVYQIIAEAESRVHGKPVAEIHFHEVGALDAVADITAVCMLMNELAPQQIIASPINTGSGIVKCAHGHLPVPAPATACILHGIPMYSSDICSELCTPTGAALIKHFADAFSNMPVMNTESIGYGMGKKDFETANCIRAFLGETESRAEDILELACNIDDMTAESLSFAAEILMNSGALDVYSTPIVMKKSRLATKLSVLCRAEDKEKMLEIIFKHTSTIGVREMNLKRYVLNREEFIKEASLGMVRIKKSSGFGALKQKYEYEDIARLAREHNISMDEVKRRIEQE